MTKGENEGMLSILDVGQNDRITVNIERLGIAEGLRHEWRLSVYSGQYSL